MEALAAGWYAGPIRTATRNATKRSDRELDELLASPEAGAAIGRMWRVILREASLALLVSIVTRSEKESTLTKLLSDLCTMGGKEAADTPPDPEADFSEFERAILDNLRAAVNGKARLTDGGDG